MRTRRFAMSFLVLGCLPTAADAADADLVFLAASRQAIPNPIPLESHPITDAKLIAKLRREGRLPDTFIKGRCRYDLAGDPGAAYYVKTCR